MKNINVDQLIAVVGKEKLSPYFLNKDWIRDQRFKARRDVRDLIEDGMVGNKEFSIYFAYYFKTSDDGKGNFNGNVDLRYLGITDLKKELPEPIKILDGNFVVSGNPLENLVGGPELEVTQSYDAENCGLKSLKGSPEIVGGWFNLSDNDLESLEYAPKEMEFGIFNRNKIKNLDKCSIERVKKSLRLEQNNLDSVEGIEKIKVFNYVSYSGNPIFNKHVDKGLTIETFNNVPKVVKEK